MTRAHWRSALMLTFGLAVAILMSPAAPSKAAADDLNSPVFVSPPANAAPAGAAQPAAETPTAPSDQLSESDRTLRDNAAAQGAPAAPIETPRSAPVVAAAGEHSVWDETSLIGKIFIGFGALLTVASAARMFMA